MVKTVVSASACALAVVLCARAPAFAQESNVSGNVLVGIGSSRAGGSADVLGTVGVKVSPYVTVNADLQSQSFKGYLADSELSRTKHRAFRYSGNLRFQYAEQSLVHPYLTAGMGAINVKKAAGGRTTKPAPNIGLGFDLWPSKHVAVGIHYRALFVDEATYHTFIAGVVFGIR
jgi:opacity protein-like surface antigen